MERSRSLSPSTTADLLDTCLAQIGMEPGRRPEVADQLAGLVELLHRWSARINLTGHRTPEAIIRGVLSHAMGLSRALPDSGSVVDLGSGAGFPGLPLALLFPHRRVTLVEARSRRHHFQRHAIRSLGIGNAEALLGRAELLDPRLHAIAVAQAVGPLSEVVPWASRWVQPGGLIAIPGGVATSGPPSKAISRVEVAWYARPLSERRTSLWLGVRAP